MEILNYHYNYSLKNDVSNKIIKNEFNIFYVKFIIINAL